MALKNIMNQIYKTVKKGQSSFKITKKMLESIYRKSKESIFTFIIRIPVTNDEYFELNCNVRKMKKFKGDSK